MSKTRETAELVLLTSGVIGLILVSMSDDISDLYYVGLGGLYFSLGCSSILKIVDFIYSMAIEDGCIMEADDEEQS